MGFIFFLGRLSHLSFKTTFLDVPETILELAANLLTFRCEIFCGSAVEEFHVRAVTTQRVYRQAKNKKAPVTGLVVNEWMVFLFGLRLHTDGRQIRSDGIVSVE